MEAWLQAAVDALDPVDVWRYGTLAAPLADSRLRALFPLPGPRSEAFHRFGHVSICRALAAAKQRTTKRERTLFGLKAPSRDVLPALSVNAFLSQTEDDSDVDEV